MSDLNLEWLHSTYQDTNDLVIFDVGANNLADAIRLRLVFPNARIICFECNRSLTDSNTILAKEYDLEYFNLAISKEPKTLVFYEYSNNLIGTLKQNVVEWHNDKKSTSQYPVPVTTLNNFCVENKVSPHFIHIDIEGSECDALADLQCKPDLIWAEYFFCGKDNLRKTVCEQGYIVKYIDTKDILFERSDCNFSNYKNTNTNKDFEQKVLLRSWISSYNNIKDSAWPDISSVDDYNKLPEEIKHECEQKFGFTVDEKHCDPR